MIENQLEAIKKLIFLGYSKKWTLNDSGCLVHCVARILKKPVLEVHERLKIMGCFYADKTGDVCLLDLTKVPQAYPQLKYIGKVNSWDQSRALSAIEQAGGLIVEVDSNSIMDGTQQHFVFFRGNREMEDPLGGKVRATTYYKNVISMRIFELQIPVEEELNMTDEQKRMLQFISERGLTEGQIRQAADWIKDGTVAKQIGELQSKVEANQKNEVKWQKDLKTANKLIENKTEEINTLTKDKADYKKWYEDALSRTVEKQTSLSLMLEVVKRNRARIVEVVIKILQFPKELLQALNTLIKN